MSSSQFVQVLRDHRDSIVARFVGEVQRDDLPPAGTARALLVDHIPKFLDDVIAELDEPQERDAARMSRERVDTSATARKHGEQRWALGYDLEALVREYGVLRHCILVSVKEANVPLTIDEYDVLAKCLSVGVAEAVAAYVVHRDAEFEGQKTQLEFLAEAGQILTSSLDYHSTLRRIVGLLVPRMADWCAVHLEGESVEDSTIANVDPAKVEMLREIYRHHLFAKGTVRGHRRVMESGEPAFVSEITPDFWASVAESPEQLKLFETVGTISWIIVPLNVQGHVFGALTLAYSESGRHYTQTDFALASELARRAAVAIDNARLYELSQSERSRVEATTRAKDEFVAMISHELRTPLNAILGWLRLMRAGGLPESKREHAFDVIERNAQAQNQLVADLLDISRIITGKIRINPSQMDLANVVEMAIEGVRPAADAKRIELQVAIDDGAAVMRGDGDRLQQVVWNLLANAVKFTPKNGVVRVHVRRVDSDFELTVTDTGPGIDAAFLPYVFESFRQAESGTARPHGGLGIGLSIVKHLVELHGGSVEAESKGAGQGTTFRVLLPISPLVSTTMGISRVAATEPQGAAAPLRGGLEGVRVLVVDDEPDARELITFVLENAGAAVRVAESARDALQAVSTFAPQVIVSDIGMPLEDGYSLVRSIRTLPAEELRNVPAIALTAFARNEDRTRALTAGFNLHMTKPVEPSALVSAVAELAGRTLR